MAEQITSLLSALMDADKTVTPADIAIIMTKSKDNFVFIQLRNVLAQMFTMRGYNNSIEMIEI